jgi:hypothetical protein
VSGDNVLKHFDKSEIPSFVKGDWSPSAEEKEAWIAELKTFYTSEFLPIMTALADNPGSVKAPELFEPAGR